MRHYARQGTMIQIYHAKTYNTHNGSLKINFYTRIHVIYVLHGNGIKHDKTIYTSVYTSIYIYIGNT